MPFCADCAGSAELDTINELYEHFPVLYYAYIFVVGLLVGSFLNVVVYRLPVMMERAFKREYLEWFTPDSEELKKEEPKFNLMVPRSRCPKCGHAITAWENIPVISWLFLRGKCSGCGLPISFRYPAVEILTAVLTLCCGFMFAPSLALFGAIFFTWSLIALSFIDFDKMLLPDEITLPLVWAGCFLNIWGSYCSLQDSVIGAIAGYGFLWAFCGLFKLFTGKEGMGAGDFKLMAAIGSWFGWQMLPAAIIGSALAGAVIGGTYLAINRSGSKPIPFGPYIAVAGLAVMYFGHDINAWYIRSVLMGN